jgi:hemerythrin superfamily protein
MADLTVVDLIEQDHRMVDARLEELSAGNRSDDAKNEVVRLLAQHSAAEEIIVYPLVGEQVSDGEALEAEAREEHQEIKEALLAFDRCSLDDDAFPDRLADLASTVRAHVAEEESVVLPALAATLDAPRLLELADEFVDQKEQAPTRPHPLAPDGPITERLAGAVAAPLDAVRDKVEGR